MYWLRNALVLAFLLVAAGTSAQPAFVLQNDGGGARPMICSPSIDGFDVNKTFTGAAGDIVVIFTGRANSSDSGTAFGPSDPANWTAIGTVDSTGPKLGIWHRTKPTAASLSVTALNDGIAAHSIVLCGYVLDATTVDATLFDQTTTTTGQVTKAVPDCPAITTQTDNALVICHSGNSVVDTTYGTVTGFTTMVPSSVNNQIGNDTDDVTIAAAYGVIAAPAATDPAAWSTWAVGIGGSFTVAWKAASASPCRRGLIGVGC